ncbi:hypothetical protein NKI56_04630 [Mesorhizobium sp. M0622]|uniref:hypothetical protein n=1 Tax=unclassified Mesorhizobium TaxID=325217 RepID=UPI0033350E8B
MQLEEMRILCAKHWNPIGIPMESTATSREPGFRPLPADEYDNYLLQIMRLVVDGADPRQISDYLGKVENEYLGLSSPAGSKDDFLNAVFALAKRSPAR